MMMMMIIIIVIIVKAYFCTYAHVNSTANDFCKNNKETTIKSGHDQAKYMTK
jgi:hypothetical protein